MNGELPFSKYKTRGILLSLVWCLFIYGFIYGIVTQLWQASIEDKLLSNILSIFIYLWILNWVRGKYRANDIDAALFFKRIRNPKPLRLFGLIVLLFLFSLSMIWLTYYPLSYISPSLVDSLVLKVELLSSTSSLLNKILELALLVVIAPITEEVFFRGILLNRWAIKWGIRKAIIASSLAFAVLHVDFIGAFFFAVVMSLLYIKTRTLVAPIAAHFLNNFLVVGVTLAFSHFQRSTIEDFRSGVWAGLALLTITLPLLIIYMKRNWPPKDQQGPYIRQRMEYGSDDVEDLAATVEEEFPLRS